jgi:exopolysaccharide biosynthesis polyprenyl glycosylphosphotransferase
MDKTKAKPSTYGQSFGPRRFFYLPLRISERRLLLIGLDLLALNIGFLISLALRPEYPLALRLIVQHSLWFILLSIIWFPIAFAFDVYDLKISGRLSTNARALFKASVVTIGLYLIIPYVTPALPGSRFTLFSFFIFTLGFLLAGRILYLLALAQPFFNHRALIIGTGPTASTIAQAILQHTNGIYNIVGFVQDVATEKSPTLLINNPNFQRSNDLTLQILGNYRTLSNIINEHQINTLILATDQNIDGELLQILTDCLEVGVEIAPMPVLYEQLTGRVPIEHIGENWYVAMPINHPLSRPLNRFIKRLSDIILASLGCLWLAPFFPFIALAIYLESPGPIFYTQERVGKGGRIFWAYKFRSMVPDAEKGEAVWAKKNDERVTRVGRLLRKTHVDEFPQFLNILKGEMSAVGPRPERPEFVEELAREIPFYRLRHAVKPGMAGWGLVKQGYGASKEDALIKLQYDLYYIKHQSLWFDLVILLKTIIDTLTFRGRA